MTRERGDLMVEDLGFAYCARSVLRAVTFAVAPGEVVGLLGPNGSGKSTLLRVASGALVGYSGGLRIGGVETRDLRPRARARRVAVVPQEPSFAFPFTVLEVVLMGRHPHLAGLRYEAQSDVEIARAALAACGALELAERDIQQLSAGERQRVVFARALAQQTPLLLLDEAGSFLDIRHQVEIYDLVRAQAEAGTAVLAVLHDLNLAAEYCDRLVLLADGAVAASGGTAEVLTYANLKRVFGTDVYVDLNDLTGSLVVTPLSRRAREALQRLAPPGSPGSPGTPAGT